MWNDVFKKSGKSCGVTHNKFMNTKISFANEDMFYYIIKNYEGGGEKTINKLSW